MASTQEIIDFIRLINTENIGPITFYKLLQKYKSVSSALKHLPQRFTPYPSTLAQKELELAHKLGIHILTFADDAYPQRLRHIADAPPILYVKGNPECLNPEKSLAIAGARNASLPGRKLASQIAFDLSNAGVMVVSGLARGIDTSAHKGALYANNQTGATIAVLGTGVDVIYPKENTATYELIAAQGAIVSEFPLGTQPSAANFPRRNRIISGLSDGTLIIEATLHSGSLITAGFALEQGREVYALPGSPNDARSHGPNKLIKEGATLIETAQDILETLTSHDFKRATPKVKQGDLFAKPLDKEVKIANIPDTQSPLLSSSRQTDILQYLTPEGVGIDEIIRISGLDSSTLSLQLLELELDGKIEYLAGNKVALIK